MLTSATNTAAQAVAQSRSSLPRAEPFTLDIQHAYRLNQLILPHFVDNFIVKRILEAGSQHIQAGEWEAKCFAARGCRPQGLWVGSRNVLPLFERALIGRLEELGIDFAQGVWKVAKPTQVAALWTLVAQLDPQESPQEPKICLPHWLNVLDEESLLQVIPDHVGRGTLCPSEAEYALAAHIEGESDRARARILWDLMTDFWEAPSSRTLSHLHTCWQTRGGWYSGFEQIELKQRGDYVVRLMEWSAIYSTQDLLARPADYAQLIGVYHEAYYKCQESFRPCAS